MDSARGTLPFPMELTEAEQLLVERGIAAETMLQDAVFEMVLNDLANQYMQGLINTQATDTTGREAQYHQIKALQGIRSTLNEWANVKEQIVLNLNQSEESE
jgi:hypothetical protein